MPKKSNLLSLKTQNRGLETVFEPPVAYFFYVAERKRRQDKIAASTRASFRVISVNLDAFERKTKSPITLFLYCSYLRARVRSSRVRALSKFNFLLGDSENMRARARLVLAHTVALLLLLVLVGRSEAPRKN